MTLDTPADHLSDHQVAIQVVGIGHDAWLVTAHIIECIHVACRLKVAVRYFRAYVLHDIAERTASVVGILTEEARPESFFLTVIGSECLGHIVFGGLSVKLVKDRLFIINSVKFEGGLTTVITIQLLGYVLDQEEHLGDHNLVGHGVVLTHVRELRVVGHRK